MDHSDRTSVILTSYANGLDNFTMNVYLNMAASQFNSIMQYTTLAVIQSMILAIGKPVFAKLADVLGRATGFAISIVLFTVGTITISSSDGMVFFSCGSTGLSFNLSLLVADLTSPRWRCTISNALTIHFVINFGIASRSLTHWCPGTGDGVSGCSASSTPASRGR